MAQQKLYTKEMFLHAAERCEVSMIDAKHIMEYIDEYVRPVKLPSDEEIEEKSFGFSDWPKERVSFLYGAKWMRDQILNK